MISLEELRAELAAAGDPAKASIQQRYMKSAMPYHGLAAPELRALLRPHLAAYSPRDRAEWERTVRAWQDVDTLGVYRHMVVTGAWWDVVDETAQHLVGACLPPTVLRSPR